MILPSRLAKLALTTALAVAPAIAPTLAPAQTPSAARTAATLNPIRDQSHPINIGVLVQSGVGITEDRGSFRFFMAGVRAGKVLTDNFGPGLLHGNFEYGVEVFPFWQSYTPTAQRQNCVYIQNPFLGTETSCSAPFTIGGTFTGVSITPIVLRWNFAGSRRIAPWIQGAGGLLWTNHKYPAFGGLPINSGGISTTAYGDNGPNDDTSVWNFTPQFGIGAHYFLSPRRSIDIGANAIHISSASLGDKNPGVNASAQFSLGYSWWK